jgi:hypothetical protein
MPRISLITLDQVRKLARRKGYDVRKCEGGDFELIEEVPAMNYDTVIMKGSLDQIYAFLR